MVRTLPAVVAPVGPGMGDGLIYLLESWLWSQHGRQKESPDVSDDHVKWLL